MKYPLMNMDNEMIGEVIIHVQENYRQFIANGIILVLPEIQKNLQAKDCKLLNFTLMLNTVDDDEDKEE